MNVFDDIRKQANEVFKAQFSGREGSSSAAASQLEGMAVLFLRLRRLNKKILVECKESKTALAKGEERVAELKLALNSMEYQAFKLSEECAALST